MVTGLSNNSDYFAHSRNGPLTIGRNFEFQGYDRTFGKEELARLYEGTAHTDIVGVGVEFLVSEVRAYTEHFGDTPPVSSVAG